MEIPEIKTRLVLSQVLDHYGLKPDKHLRLNCPFHPDKTPSLQVYYKTQTCYCFSSNCPTHGKSMDVIDFIMYKESCGKAEAIKKAIELSAGESNPSNNPSKTVSPAVKPTVRREQILTKMFAYFRNAVPNSPPAREYLESRSLDPTLLEIGYNSGQFHHAGRFRKAGSPDSGSVSGAKQEDALIEACVKVGLLSPSGSNTRSGGQGYKPFAKGCICFPLRDRSGQVGGLYFRSTTDNKDQRHFYLKDRSGLYPEYPGPETQKLILTESIIDAASLLQQETIAKQYGILALYGTNGLTEEHTEAIKSLESLDEVIFFLNGDDPGRKAVSRHAETLRSLNSGLALSSVDVPENEDVNSLLQAHEPGVLAHLLEARLPWGNAGTFLSCLPADKFSIENAPDEKERSPAEGRDTKEPEAPKTGKIAAGSGARLDTRNPYKLSYVGKASHYAILGGISRTPDSMKVTLQVEHPETKRKSRNKVDLYEDKQVERLCKEVSERLNLRKDLLEEDIYRLTDVLDAYRETLVNAATEKRESPQLTPLTAKERQELEAFAKQPGLIQRLGGLLGKTGIVGEDHNRIFLFLVAFSHKLPEPLHALIQGSSGSGKTRLMRQVSDCMPEENVDRFTRISDKALYNFPETYFVNHLLCLEDMDGLSEEAEYSARELISGGELRSAVSVKNESGQISEGQRIVRGPVASLCCTTKGEVYEDNMSRVFLIAVDESSGQTERIIRYQDRKAAGIIDGREEQKTKRFLQQLMRMLKPHEVVNPFAGKVSLPKEAHKIRRLNELFQGFIKIITVVNQYQRKKDGQGRLTATTEDLATAIGIMFESIVLKVDELDGPLRQFYESLKTFIEKKGKDYEFNRFDAMQASGLKKSQLQVYLNRLIALEYVRQYGFANRGFTYRISHWDDYTALRARIKSHLTEQLVTVKNKENGLASGMDRKPDRKPEVPVASRENTENRQGSK